MVYNYINKHYSKKNNYSIKNSHQHNTRTHLHLMEESTEPLVTGEAVATHEGTLARPQVLTVDPHKVFKGVLAP